MGSRKRPSSGKWGRRRQLWSAASRPRVRTSRIAAAPATTPRNPGATGSRKTDNLPPSNFVFLLDVSGSMMPDNKLPLVKSAMRLLVNQLRPQDRVAMIVYAGSAGLVLPSTPGNQKDKILDAIDRLEAGGSTAGGEGIRRAYDEAVANFVRGGNNRVILVNDGDFNISVECSVGTTWTRYVSNT